MKYYFSLLILLLAGCQTTRTLHTPLLQIGAYGDGSFKKDTHVLMGSDGKVLLRGVNAKGDTVTVTYQASEETQIKLFNDAKAVSDHYNPFPEQKRIYADSEIFRFTHCPTIGIELTLGNSKTTAWGNIDTCDPIYDSFLQFAKEIDSALNTTHLNILPFDKY